MVALLDDFNRADSASVGAAYTQRGGIDMRITSNAALPVSTGGLAVAETIIDAASNDMFSEAVIKQLGASSALMLYLGASTTEQVYGYFQPGQNVIINTSTAAYSAWSGTSRAASSAALTVTAGDTVRIERVAGVYTCKKNGAAIPGASWSDVGGTTFPYQDSSHRKTAFGLFISTAGDSVDSWAAGDIGGSTVSPSNFFGMF